MCVIWVLLFCWSEWFMLWPIIGVYSMGGTVNLFVWVSFYFSFDLNVRLITSSPPLCGVHWQCQLYLFLGYVEISWLIWSVDILDELKFPSVHDRSVDIFRVMWWSACICCEIWLIATFWIYFLQIMGFWSSNDLCYMIIVSFQFDW